MPQESYLVGQSEVDVLDIRLEGTKKLFSHPTHLASDLLSKLQFALSQSGHLSDQEAYDLFAEGVKCGFLKVGNPQWQSGRIRVCLEFIPDAEEAPDNFIEPEISIGFPLNGNHKSVNGAN